jgi:D-alanine-D-alanine ligase
VIKNIALLYGGRSGEHEVSCVSAKFLYNTINNAGYNAIGVFIDQKGTWHLQKTVETKIEIQQVDPCHLIKNNNTTLKTKSQTIEIDFIFPIIHGTTGEDGRLQGFLEFLDIPYAGSGVLSSSLCMDKYMSKRIFEQAGIPQVKYKKYDAYDWAKNNESIVNDLEKSFSYPVFIKPSNMGSSVGVSKVNQKSELIPAIQAAFQYDNQIICEVGHFVREVEVAILGNYPEYKVSIAGEIVPLHSYYSYEAKYVDNKGAELSIPAPITQEQLNKIQAIAVDAFKAVRADGFARIDFFIDKSTNLIYLNEINTLPGFTPISMFPMLWEKTGLSHTDLIKDIICLGEAKFLEKKSLKTDRQ